MESHSLFTHMLCSPSPASTTRTQDWLCGLTALWVAGVCRASLGRATQPLSPAPSSSAASLGLWTFDPRCALTASDAANLRERLYLHPSEVAEALSSETPFFSGKMQIHAHRTRDLWTQQYLCTPPHLHKQGQQRKTQGLFWFSLENNERVNIKLF